MSLNKFPELVLINIFDNLNLNELIKNRRVCKQWKYLIDKRIEYGKELCLFINLPVQNTISWKYNDQLTNLNCCLSIDRNKIIRNLNSFQKMKITKLLIYVFELNEVLLRDLTALMKKFEENLEHYQLIVIKGITPIRKRLQVNLQKLKTFYVDSSSFLNVDFADYNFQNLERFSAQMMTVDERSFECLQKLKYLNVYELRQRGKKFKFDNLEVLHLPLNVYRTLRIGNEHLESEYYEIPLSDLPALKELHIAARQYDLDYCLKQLDYYLKEKEASGRKDLKMFFKGFEYTDKLRDEGFLHQNKTNKISEDFLEYYKEHRSNFDAFPFQFELTDSFIRRLESLNHIKKKLIDNTNKCEIMTDFSNLKDCNLIFDKCDTVRLYKLIPNSNLNCLSKHFPNAKEIIFLCNDIANYELDFNFIFKFKSIKIVDLPHFEIPLEIFKKMIENCKYLEFSCFKNMTYQLFDGSILFMNLDENEQFKNKAKFLRYLSKIKNR